MTGQLSPLRRELALYLSAQQFLTRLPAPAWVGWEDDRLARAARYFPMVGVFLGAAAGGVWLLAAQALPAAVAAGLALGALLILTGALHEDGFADCCDGLGGGRTTARALEIMRDSRIGAYGAAGIVMSLGLRWAALAALAPAAGFAAIIIALAAGRAGMALTLHFGSYARADGAATSARGVTGPEAAFAALIAIIAGAVLGGAAGIAAVVLTLLLAIVWLAYVRVRLGGYTGDTLGAAEQIGQIATLLVLAGAWT